LHATRLDVFQAVADFVRDHADKIDRAIHERLVNPAADRAEDATERAREIDQAVHDPFVERETNIGEPADKVQQQPRLHAYRIGFARLARRAVLLHDDDAVQFVHPIFVAEDRPENRHAAQRIALTVLDGMPAVDQPAERDARNRDADRQSRDHRIERRVFEMLFDAEHILADKLAEEGDAEGRRVCKSDHAREEREHREWHPHHFGRFVRVLDRVMIARFAEESQENLARHIERGEERGNRQHHKDRACHLIGMRAETTLERVRENFVLAPKTRERRNARERERADDKDRRGDRHLFPQAAHAHHVVRADAVNHAARAQEQQRLEERVRDEMERARDVRADAERGDHEPKLRNRRVREHALDVVLRDADRRGEERGECADNRDGGHRGSARFGGGNVERVRARDQIHTRGDHRRGVDQRADGRGTFHRIRQPDVQRKLRGLANRPAENQQRDHRDPRHARERLRFGEVMQRFFVEDCVEVQIFGMDVKENQANEENRIADARREKRFDRGEFRAHGLRVVNVMFVRAAHRPKADQ